MTNSQRLATVRAHLRRWLCEHAPSACKPADGSSDVTEESQPDQVSPGGVQQSADLSPQTVIRSESILIRDGFYAGRTFEATALGLDYRASWFMEPDELKIHAATGEVIAVFQGDQMTEEEVPQPQPVEIAPDEVQSDDELAPIAFPISTYVKMPIETGADHTRVDENDDRVSKAA